MATDRSRSLFGILVIIAGIVLLLNNLGVTQVNILLFWPILLILWGLNWLVTGSRNPGAQAISLFIAVLGFILLAGNLNWFQVNLGTVFRFFWPVLIILIGLTIFLGRSFSGKTNVAILGAVERGKNTSWELESGSYLAFMGGVDLDLSHAIIPDGETHLDLTAVMGGIEIKVPDDLPVYCDGFAIMGGIEFFGKGSGGIIGSIRNERNLPESSKVLKIQARAMMGGIEVKAL
jgi:predicted membrane protein